MTTKFIGAACLVAGAILSGVTVVDAHSAPIAHHALAFEDIVSGEWDGLISGEQMPQEVEVLITLELDGEDVTGGFTVQGETADFTGEFDEESSTITGVLSDPQSGQNVDVEMTIDGDELTGSITIVAGDMTIVLDLSATRRK